MTVGELTDLLLEVDRDRTVYVPGLNGSADVLTHVVDLRHVNLPVEMNGIAIPDDVALLPVSVFESTEPIDD
jgi:hypothetical protein